VQVQERTRLKNRRPTDGAIMSRQFLMKVMPSDKLPFKRKRHGLFVRRTSVLLPGTFLYLDLPNDPRPNNPTYLILTKFFSMVELSQPFLSLTL